MQKQKTLAKWLAIILLCSIAVGSYVLYDALYLDKDNNQATAVGGSGNDGKTDGEQTEGNEHQPYYTVLPRKAEKIDGISVTHFGGESDDTLQGVIKYADKRFCVFSSNSVEFDMREKGLSVALVDDGVEKVTHLTKDGTFVNGKMSSKGVAILTKSTQESTLFFLDTNCQIIGKISLPNLSDGLLYLSNGNLYLFAVLDGFLTVMKIHDNMTVTKSPFIIETTHDYIEQIFENKDGYVLIASDKMSLSIFMFDTNNGFRQTFSQYKLSFKQIITAGTKTESNYILYGTLKGEPWLYAFDNDLDMLSSKKVDGVTDGIILPHADGLLFVGNGVTKSYCKHLDEVLSSSNDFTFETVAHLTPGNGGIFALTTNSKNHNQIVYIDGEITLVKDLDFDVDLVGLYSQNDGFCLAVNSSSTTGIFRANFGGYDPFILDFDFSFLLET